MGWHLCKSKRAKELADALKKFEGVDVEEYRGLKDKRDEIEQQHQLAHGNYNDAVAKATEKMQADFTKQVRSLTDRLGTIEQERNQALADLKRYNIERELERAAVKLRVRPEYDDDLRLRVDKFDIADGHVVVIGPDGEPRRSGKDARHYMLPEKWLESMQGEKPGWFEPSAGAGAVGGTRARGRGPVIDRDDLDAFAANLERSPHESVGDLDERSCAPGPAPRGRPCEFRKTRLGVSAPVRRLKPPATRTKP